MSRELLSGWGRTAAGLSEVVEPTSVVEALAGMAGVGPRGVVARGLGRAYGDAAQNTGGRVLRMAAVDGADRVADGVVRVEAGVSLDTLMRSLLPAGWFVPVSPGTRAVTVGGAVAADIHGKNHHLDGSLGHHLRRLSLGLPGGEVRALEPGGPGFWPTVGGMGLTGVVLDADLALLPVETSRVRVDTERLPDLDALMAAMESGDAGYRYSVAWVDCLASGRSLGRAVLTRGDHASLAELPASERETALAFAPRRGLLRTPPGIPSGLLNRLSVRAFNEAWFRHAPRAEKGRLVGLASFFHPLDGVRDWNRLYGPRGFVQYQYVVPPAAARTVRRSLELLSSGGAAPFLAVFKRFGEGTPGALSFPMPGWTLALDIPVRSGLSPLLRRLDEMIAEAGGRVYLAKDSRLAPDMMRLMYPRLAEWQAARAELDPGGVMQSDLSRRLRLDD
ncbi:MAG: FAD-binding protein [Candidatus Dormibacteria bacterium]